MPAGIGTVEVKKQRGKIVVNGLGQTPRGQNFIRKQKALGVARISDPKFKSEMAAAVTELLSETPSPS